jgi:hypothetical protein
VKKLIAAPRAAAQVPIKSRSASCMMMLAVAAVDCCAAPVRRVLYQPSPMHITATSIGTAAVVVPERLLNINAHDS